MTLHTGSTGPIIRANTCEPEVMRQLIAIESQSIPGVVGNGDLVVAQSGTPNMGVQVASGFAIVGGTSNAPVQGYYHGYNDAAVALTIAAADPTNPRWDLVCMTVRDAFYSGGSSDIIFQVITGTPAGSPALPATPANSIALAKVVVAALATSIVNANITDLRAWCGPTAQARGILPGGYASTSATQSAIGNNVAITGLTSTVTIAAGRRIKITAKVGLTKHTLGLLAVNLMEGATQLNQWIETHADGDVTTATIMHVFATAPSAGSHTYFLQMGVSAGTADATATATALNELVVEDIGAY